MKYDASLMDYLITATDGMYAYLSQHTTGFNYYIIRTPADIKRVVLEGYMTFIRRQLEHGQVDKCSELLLTKDLFSFLR